jgi:hypothetical protein
MSAYHNEWYHKNKETLKHGRQARHQVEYRKRKQFIKEAKLAVGYCSICEYECGEHNHVAFDWDHINPEEKSFSLGDTRSQTWEKIKLEISKCRLVCKNCHAIETHRLQHWKIRKDTTPVQDNQLELMSDDL